MILGGRPLPAGATPKQRDCEHRFAVIRSGKHTYAQTLQTANPAGMAIIHAITERIREPWQMDITPENNDRASPADPVAIHRVHNSSIHQQTPWGADAWLPVESAAALVQAVAQVTGLDGGIADLPPGHTLTARSTSALTGLGLRYATLARGVDEPFPGGDPRASARISLHAERWPMRDDETALRKNPLPWPDHAPRFAHLPRCGAGSAELHCIALLMREQANTCGILRQFAWVNNGLPFNATQPSTKQVQAILDSFGIPTIRTSSPAAVRLAGKSGAAALFWVGSHQSDRCPLVRMDGNLYDPHDFVGVTGAFARGNPNVPLREALVVTLTSPADAIVTAANTLEGQKQ